jgi:tRNA(Ile)-lysidine synthase
LNQKNILILKEHFFSQSSEVVFRSLTEVIKIVGKKYYAVRGKKIDKIIDLVNAKTSFKVTLGGCIIKKVNETVILCKE